MPPTETMQMEQQLLLTHPGANKIRVIQLVRELTGLGLKEAKDLVDAAPSRLAIPVDPDAAADLAARFAGCGARVEFVAPGDALPEPETFAPEPEPEFDPGAGREPRSTAPLAGAVDPMLKAARASGDPEVRRAGDLVERGLDLAERAGLLTRLRFVDDGLNIYRVEFHSPLENFLAFTAWASAGAALLLVVAGIDPSARMPLAWPAGFAMAAIGALILRMRTDVHHAIDVTRRRILRRFRFLGLMQEYEVAEFREIAAIALDTRRTRGKKRTVNEHAIAVVLRDGRMEHLSGWSSLAFAEAHEATRAMAARMCVPFVPGGEEAPLVVTRMPGGTLEIRHGNDAPHHFAPIRWLIAFLALLAFAALFAAR